MTFPSVTRAGFVLAAADVTALSQFYRSVFDFTVAATFEDPPYVILEKQGMRLSLTGDGSGSDDFPDFIFQRCTSTTDRPAAMILEVEDCDLAFEELTRQHVTIRSSVFRPPWGGARFFCEDPEGNVIEIEQLA